MAGVAAGRSGVTMGAMQSTAAPMPTGRPWRRRSSRRRLLVLTTAVAALVGAWLWLVAPAGAGSAADPGLDEIPKGITFVAYNVENYLLMPRHVDGEPVPDAPKPEASIRHLLRIIAAAEPDILGVCEIGRDQVPDLQRRLAEVGLDLPHAEVAGGGDVVRELALLSRWPIVASDSRRDLTYQLDGHVLPMQRGILDATVELPDGSRLRCVGVHFKSKREIPEFDQELMRRHEATLLRRHIDAIFAADPDVRLLVYGDLNDTRNEPAVRAVLGPHQAPTSLRLVDVADDRGQRWTHHWAVADLYSRIDYLMVSRRLWPLVVAEESYIPFDPDFRLASDHRPLVLRLRLDDRP